MPSIPLLLADAANIVLGTLLAPQWGIYLQGVPVIQPASLLTQTFAGSLAPLQQIASLLGAPSILPVSASTVSFEYSNDQPISTYPQEEGAFQSYNKVAMPFDVRMKLACGGPASVRQAFIDTCVAVSNSLSLFDVVTPEKVYRSCNVTRIDWRRQAQRGATLLVVELWFQQVQVASSTTFANTQQPGENGPQALGNVQPQAPNAALSSGFSPGSVQ